VDESGYDSSSLIFCRFSNEFNLVNVCAEEMWILFSDELCTTLTRHAKKQSRPDNEYINLQFKVKFLWKNYVAGLDSYKTVVPGYSK